MSKKNKNEETRDLLGKLDISIPATDQPGKIVQTSQADLEKLKQKAEAKKGGRPRAFKMEEQTERLNIVITHSTLEGLRSAVAGRYKGHKTQSGLVDAAIRHYLKLGNRPKQ